MHLLAPFTKPKTHEELFLEHYGKLVEWALQVTQRRQDEANDLVHDLYVQLIRTRPDIDLSDDDRVRGYLYTMLRNLIRIQTGTIVDASIIHAPSSTKNEAGHRIANAWPRSRSSASADQQTSLKTALRTVRP